VLFASALHASAFEGDLLNNRHGAGSGKSYKEISAVYVARTPYILEWRADEKYNLYDKDPRWKAKDTQSCVHVFDEKGNIIAKTQWGGLTGSVKVPVGGRHQVRVFSLGQWHANIIEDAELLKQAQRDGYLTKTSIVTPAARAASPAGRRESVAAMMTADVQALEGERAGIPEDAADRQSRLNELDDKIHKVKLAASRSSDVVDYEKRKAALIPSGL
jgi:hypothetical protein